MSKAAKPALITLALSAAAILGYVTYRIAFDQPAPAGHAAHMDAETSPPALPDALPEFSMTGLDGDDVSIQSWPGQPLVINFWATWCAPCLREIPMLKSFQDDHPWLTVVGIAIDDMPKVETFAADMGFNYPILIGQTEGVNAAASFGVDFYALPFTIFTDAQGRTLGVRTGELHAEQLEQLVALLESLEAGRTSLDEARARLEDVM